MVAVAGEWVAVALPPEVPLLPLHRIHMFAPECDNSLHRLYLNRPFQVIEFDVVAVI